MKKLRVSVICDEANDGWIYSEFIRHLKAYSKHTILVNEKKEDLVDIFHFVPYYSYYKTTNPSTCWLSHQEKSKPLKSKFIKVAQAVDVGISHSQKYATMLRDNHECTNVVAVHPGIDAGRFKLRATDRVGGDKLIVGHVGRRYSSSNRKNPQLIDKISKLSFVDFRATDGKLSAEQIPKFIQDCDVIISPATIEGGPMVLGEALACGTPIISMQSVGATNEFGIGVIKAHGNDDFIRKLTEMWSSGRHIGYWRKKEVMNTMREQITALTWERWALEHDNVWAMIGSKSWKKA